MGKNSVNKRQNRGTHRRLSGKAAETSAMQLERLRCELGIPLPLPEEEPVGGKGFGLSELLVVGGLFMAAGLLN